MNRHGAQHHTPVLSSTPDLQIVSRCTHAQAGPLMAGHILWQRPMPYVDSLPECDIWHHLRLPMQLLLSGPSHLMTGVGFVDGQLSGRMLARCLNRVSGRCEYHHWPC